MSESEERTGIDPRPVTEARCDHIRDNGGNPFNELTLPDALIKFRQGVGRLIRTAKDRGLVTILDSRVLAKTYGKLFLDCLPLIERYAFDNRNFVRKAVNWALRNIGKRNARLLPPAIACAKRIRAQDSKSARWIAADALREFRLKYPSAPE